MGKIITILIGILAIVAVIAGIIQFLRNRKSGCGSCFGCPHAGDCSSKKEQEDSRPGADKTTRRK